MPTVQLRGQESEDPPDCVHRAHAVIVGDVTVEERASVWYNAVLRGDFNPIVVGRGANVQDCAVVHVHGRAAGPRSAPASTVVTTARSTRRRSVKSVSSATARRCSTGRASACGDGGRGRPGDAGDRDPDGTLALGAPREGARAAGRHAGRALVRANPEATRPSPSVTRPRSSPAEVMKPRRIAFLVSRAVTFLDVVGAYDALRRIAAMANRFRPSPTEWIRSTRPR